MASPTRTGHVGGAGFCPFYGPPVNRNFSVQTSRPTTPYGRTLQSGEMRNHPGNSLTLMTDLCLSCFIYRVRIKLQAPAACRAAPCCSSSCKLFFLPSALLRALGQPRWPGILPPAPGSPLQSHFTRGTRFSDHKCVLHLPASCFMRETYK